MIVFRSDVSCLTRLALLLRNPSPPFVRNSRRKDQAALSCVKKVLSKSDDETSQNNNNNNNNNNDNTNVYLSIRTISNIYNFKLYIKLFTN